MKYLDSVGLNRLIVSFKFNSSAVKVRELLCTNADI